MTTKPFDKMIRDAIDQGVDPVQLIYDYHDMRGGLMRIDYSAAYAIVDDYKQRSEDDKP